MAGAELLAHLTKLHPRVRALDFVVAQLSVQAIEFVAADPANRGQATGLLFIAILLCEMPVAGFVAGGAHLDTLRFSSRAMRIRPWTPIWNPKKKAITIAAISATILIALALPTSQCSRPYLQVPEAATPRGA
jgi:hypothetical protein